MTSSIISTTMSTMMPSLCGWQVLRTVPQIIGTSKDRKRSVIVCCVFYHFYLVASMHMQFLVFWFGCMMKAFVAWTSIPVSENARFQTLRSTPNLEAHPCFNGRNTPWPSTHFQGPDPPPSPQTHGDSKDLRNSLESWRC